MISLFGDGWQMKRRSLFFTAPGKMDLHAEELATPEKDQVQVEMQTSAISAGTELLLYRGEAPADLPADDTLPALRSSLTYPFKYGYAAVGKVGALGKGVNKTWSGQRVFAFNPHETSFNATIGDLQRIPEECTDEDAAFLANTETALNLVLDAAPRIGERVVVLGQGVLGLLTTAILASHPLDALLTFDLLPTRRKFSRQMGAELSLNASSEEEIEQARARLGDAGADLVVELSGHPQALDLALRLAGPQSRIVVGSWYGLRRSVVDLGTHFHRGRVQIISSQVGEINPALRGRWDRQRRFNEAWKLVAEIKPSRLVTHRFPLDRADQAYAILDQKETEAVAVLLSY